MGFELTVENRGFVNNGAQTALAGNGTFFTKRDFFPVLGYDAQRQLADADERRRRGLGLLSTCRHRRSLRPAEHTPGS